MALRIGVFDVHAILLAGVVPVSRVCSVAHAGLVWQAPWPRSLWLDVHVLLSCRSAQKSREQKVDPKPQLPFRVVRGLLLH